MRVGFVTDATQIGGSEIWLTQVLPLLRAHNVDAYSAMPPAAATERIRNSLRAAGVETLTYENLSELPPADVYVTSTWTPPSLARMLKTLPRPVVHLVHDWIEMFIPYGVNYVYRIGYRLLQAPLLRRTDMVITVSDWARDFLEQVHKVPNVHAIHNGVDVNRFRPPTPGERKELRHRFGFSGLIAVMPARFALEKNQLAAILAARNIPGLTLALAGSGPLERAIRSATGWLRAKNVVFLGHVKEMPELYRAADLLFSPTFGENQSLVVLEAMASGLPVLTSNIRAQRELVEDGVEGWLAPPWPPRHLRRRLLEALSDESALRQAGERARARVESEHTLERTARELAAALRPLA